MQHTVVVSPMDNFMSSNMYYHNESALLQYGLQGRVRHE
jgi:hypothetical protein